MGAAMGQLGRSMAAVPEIPEVAMPDVHDAAVEEKQQQPPAQQPGASAAGGGGGKKKKKGKK